jgi:hypothetical protein
VPKSLAPRTAFPRLGDEEGAPQRVLDGIGVDDLTGPARGMAQAHFGELDALFAWLTDAEQASPWQSDLRSSDDDD